MDSDDEDDEDATSWDGGDEDEPDQMEVDDYEEDEGDDSSDGEEAHSLVVTLRYGKGAFDPRGASTSTHPSQSAGLGNDLNPQPASSTGVPQANAGSQRMPELAAPQPQAIVAAATPSELLPPPPVTFIPNGVPVATQQPPIVPVVHQHPPASNLDSSLPRLDGFYSPSTVPYSAPDAASKPQQYPIDMPKTHMPQEQQGQQQQPPGPPFPSTALPPPTPASSWQ